MKTFNHIPRKLVNAIMPLGALLFVVSSCTVSQNTTAANDGIYYDPSTHPKQEDVVLDDSAASEVQNAEQTYTEPIHIGGKYFDEEGNAPKVSSYEESPVYQSNRVVLNTDPEDDYVEWGDQGRTEIYINNYTTGFYNPHYNPYFNFGPYFGGNYFNVWGGFGYGLGFGYRWSPFNRPYYPGFYNPYHPYYGYAHPYYGYNSYYRPYHPYYGYDYYPNRYFRDVTRGKGNSNNVSASRNRKNARSRELSVAKGLRRSDKILNRSETINSQNNRVQRSNNAPLRRRSTDKIRVRRTYPKSNHRTNNSNKATPRNTNPRKNQPAVQSRRRSDKVPVRTRRSSSTNKTKYNSPAIQRSAPVMRSVPRTSSVPSRSGGIRRK